MMDWTLITGFDWDQGNARKHDKHGVSMAEAEQVFFNQPLLLLADMKHSQSESRFYALGKSGSGRVLQVTCTLRGRGSLIRVISVRDRHRMERTIYEQTH